MVTAFPVPNPCTVIVGLLLAVARVNLETPGAPLIAHPAAEDVSVSPNTRCPIVRGASSVTATSAPAARSSVAKLAMMSAPSATVLFDQLVGTLHAPPDALIHTEPSAEVE